MFEQEGLFEYVVFGELQNDFIVLDDDLMSMEYPQFLTNYFLVRLLVAIFYSRSKQAL